MTGVDADHYRQLFVDLPVGWVLHRDGLVLDVNPAAQAMFGAQGREDVIGTALFSWVHPSAHLSVRERLAQLHAGGRPVAAVMERMVRKDGAELWIETVASLTAIDGRPAVQVLCWDVTQRVREERRLTIAVLHDRLTGLPNRAFLEQRWAALLEELGPGDPLPVLLFADLDGNKHVNDTLGHAVGDQVLIALSSRLTAAVRAVDVVGRLAGDEFVVLVDRRGSPDPGIPVDRLVDRLVEAVRTPVHVVGKQVRVGLSVGVAAAGAAREPFEDVLRRADTAMYVEKAAGRRQGASDGPDEAAAGTTPGPPDSNCIA